MEVSQIKKAIILQNKFIGDVLVASVLAKNLKRLVPGVQVHFFCYDKAISVLEDNPFIDKIIYFDDHKLRKFPVLWKYAMQIRKSKYDLLIDPYSKLQSRFITFFSGAKIRISYDKPFFKYLYNYRIKEKKKPQFVCCTSIENRLRLLSPIEEDMSTYDFRTEIYISDMEKKNAVSEMKQKGVDFSKPIMMIGALGSAPEKSLPAKTMAEVIDFLTSKYDANFILNYVPNQQNEINEILELVENPNRLFLDILGKDVRHMLSLLSQVTVFIGNEGGAINMAKALEIPTFSIYSPHKFREDWGCFENESIHTSVHLEEFKPEYLFQANLRKIIKDPVKEYALYESSWINQKLSVFLNEIGIGHKTSLTLKEPQSFEPKISALLITKNEEKNISHYLEDVNFADEIIIVDSFSTDHTKEIAIQHPKVQFIERKFDNFSNQKNFAISKAKNPWILFFDTDERISKSLRAEILTKIKIESPYDAYYIRRRFFFFDKPMHYSGWQNDKAIRLFKNGKGKYGNHKFVHETLEVNGKIGKLTEAIDHYSLTNLTTYQRKLNLYAKLKAQELFQKGVKPNFFHYQIKPVFRFIHHFIFRFGFLDGKQGYIIATMYKNYVSKRYFYLDRYWENVEKSRIKSS